MVHTHSLPVLSLSVWVPAPSLEEAFPAPALNRIPFSCCVVLSPLTALRTVWVCVVRLLAAPVDGKLHTLGASQCPRFLAQY